MVSVSSATLGVRMTPELVALAALYGSHQTCVVQAPHQRPSTFFSDTSFTPDKRLLVQRNYDAGSSEIIVYSYDLQRRRYIRTQLTSDGDASSATSSGPVKGVWTWTNVAKSPNGKIIVRHFAKFGNVLHYWDWQGATSECH